MILIHPTDTLATPIDCIVRRNVTEPASTGGAYNHAVWQGGLNVASVDLIAMVVSDAGLASTSPEWWNCSPFGCILIGLQPRGGWQIIQRAVQWGEDYWARCFGVKCDMPVLYQYFACTVRNRLEVWNSKDFICPTIGPNNPASNETKAISPSLLSRNAGGASPGTTHPVAEAGTASHEPHTSLKKPKSKVWKKFDVDPHCEFSVNRPTKLTDGSRGGQAFMCKLLRPPDGQAYSVDEQARMQMWSVLLVAVGLMHRREVNFLSTALEKDFQMTAGLGRVFVRLARGLVIANILVVGFIVTVFYALWQRNIFGQVAPFIIQLCSLASWAVGATGLLMFGGNPSVAIRHEGDIPMHIKKRIYHVGTPTSSPAQDPGIGQNTQEAGNSLSISPLPDNIEGTVDDGRLETDINGNVNLSFGSLHGSIFTDDQGKCHIPGTALEAICSLEMTLTRTYGWYLAIIWFLLHLAASITLQIAGAKVATVASEIMGVGILIATSVFRGAGVSGPEKWMIPGWAMRPGAEYAVPLLNKFLSRAAA